MFSTSALPPETLQQLVDELDRAVAVIDHQGDVLYANRRAREASPPWPDVVREAVDLHGSPATRREGRLPDPSRGRSWRAQYWRLGAHHVAVVLVDEEHHAGGDTSLVAERFGLTPPEARLAIEIGNGLSNVAIALRFGISEATVKMRLSRLYRKLGVASRADLASRIGALLYGRAVR